MGRAGTTGVLAAACGVLCLAPIAAAQIRADGYRLDGEVEAGGRLFIEEPSRTRSAKFEEYRDLPEGPVLEGLRLRLLDPGERHALELLGTRWGQEDQEYLLRADRLGLWRAEFEWNQIPHLYSTTARSLASETSPGVFTLPTPRPSLSAWNSAPRLDEIGVRWDAARLSFWLTPAPDLDLKAQYTRTKKEGERPFGVAFGSPGNNFLEVLEPIDQTVHDFRVGGTLARERYQLQFGYTFSMFENGERRVLADNPCFGLAQCGTDAAGAPARGQVSLPPSNMAHTLTLAGGLNLPMRTRVTSNVSYSLRLQNDEFLPHTINPALVSPVLTLPQSSLDGHVQTFLLNLNAVTRPLRRLSLTGKYRLYDYNDLSDEPEFPGSVIGDRTITVEDRRSGRYNYTRQNGGLDARWQFPAPVALTLGGGWERWDRTHHREVQDSDELSAKAALDVTPADWLLARLTYNPSFRRIDRYNTFAHLAHTVTEEDLASAAPQSQSPLLRKYDEADRDRQRVELMLQLAPTDVFTATTTAAYGNDDYPRSPLGLQHAESWSAGIDLSWTPLERVALSAGYVHEYVDQRMRSRDRERTFTTPAIVFDFPDFDWISDSTDTIDTFHAGATATLIPQRLDWTMGASYSYALGRVDTRNPLPVTSGTAAQRANATARPFPAVEDALLRLDAGLRYHFWKVWTARLGYVFESFEKHDWRTDRLNAFVPGVTSIWLGNDLRNYTAQFVVVTLGYRFR